jgi:hypothetical protein
MASVASHSRLSERARAGGEQDALAYAKGKAAERRGRGEPQRFRGAPITCATVVASQMSASMKR